MAQGFQAGAAYSIYRLNLRGFDQDVAAIKREFDAIEQRARQPLSAPRLPSAPSGGGSGGSQSAQLQRDADAALRLAQAQARLALAEGDSARASSILSTALQTNTAASERASLAVQTQIARIESGSGAFQQFGQAAGQSLLSVIGPAAAATAAIGALRGVADSVGEAFAFKAGLDQQRAAIEVQLRGVRDTGQVFSQAAAYANRYKLTQQETTDAIQAALPVVRNSKVSMEDILGTFDRLRVRSPEKTFQDAARALSELQAGQVTSIEHLFNVPAADANRMKQEIAGGADAIKVVSDYLTRAGIGMDALAAKTTGAAGALKDVQIAEENVKLAEAQLASGPGLVALDIKARALTGISRLLSSDFSSAGQSISGTFQAVTAQAEVYRSTLNRTGSETSAFIAAWNAMSQAQNEAATQSQNAAASLSATEQAEQQAAQAAAQQAAAQQAAATAIANNTALITDQNGRLTEMAAVTREAAEQSLLDSEAKALQGQQTQVLQEQTRFAAEAFMQLHPSISAAGVASLVMAGQLDPLIGQLVAVRLQAQQAQAALLAVANARNAASVQATVDRNRAAGGGLSSGETAEREAAFARATQEHNKAVAAGIEQTNKRLDAQADAYKKVRDAQEQQVLATGSAAQQQATLNTQLERARVTYGEQSVEFVRAQTALKQFQQQQEKGGRKGGGGGAKLSDQARLNNQLLANQEQYQAKSEDEARKHEEALLKIERDFDKKSLEQQRLNEGKKRESRYTFYRSLADASKDLGEAEAQAFSAAYEQAFAESQALAQNGQHKLAADRLALRQQQIQQDIEAAKEIRAAEEEGDTKRAESLRQLETLRKDAQAEELKQLEAGGDQLVNDRQKAIDDEAARYESAQDKNGLAAERKADRAVSAADREKQAIGDVNELLAKQNALYGANGRPTTSPPPSSTTTAPTSEAPAPSTPATTAQDAARLTAVFDAAVVGAIENQTVVLGGKLDTIVGRLDNVERAVRSSRPGSVT